MAAIPLSLPSGGVVSLALGGASIELEELELSSDPRAVAEAVRAGDAAGAARILRRHWREFQVGIEPDSPFPIYGMRASPLGRFRWVGEVPAQEGSDAAEEAAEAPSEGASEDAVEDAVEAGGEADQPADAQPAEDVPNAGDAQDAAEQPEPAPAGGLSLWQDRVERVTQDRPEGLEILARYPELRSELERSLQVRETRALDAEQPVVEALAQADAAARGVEQATQERIAALEGGTLGKRGQMELLALLDETPDAEGAEQVVRSLVGAVSPLDAEQARRLARVLARAGAQDEAIRLYRWCATTAGGGAARMSFSPFDEQGTTVTVAELVQEAKEVIDAERRLGLVESILSLSVAPRYPWAREQAELEQLRVWEELVGPAEAFTRARALCEASLDLSTGLRRRVALRAAPLFAHGGEVAGAVRALEVGLASLPEDEVAQPEERWYRVDPSELGRLGVEDLRRLLAPELCEGESGARLLTALEEALSAWLAAGRVRPENAVQALCVCGLRRLERGELERARALGLQLAAREEVLDGFALWVADLCARAGAPEARDRIEEALLAEGRLGFQRELPALQRLAAREGAAPAVQVAEALAAETRPKGLLAWIVEQHQELGDEAAAARWEAQRAADEAAGARLAELDAAEAKAAEEGRAEGKAPAMTVVPGTLMRAIRIGP